MKRAGGPPLAESHDVFIVNKWHLNMFWGHFITFWLPLDAPKWSDHTPESTSAVYWLSTL